MEKELLIKLDERLEEIMKVNPTRTISACRYDVVNEFKTNGTIKYYVPTSNRDIKYDEMIYWGSCVGFDTMFRIYF